MLLKKDINKINEKGLTEQIVNEQINRFKQGYPSLKIIKAATVNNGIKAIQNNELSQLVNYYEDNSKQLKMVKFVPASGAASRMFKNLFEILNSYKGSEEDYLKLMENQNIGSFYHMYQNIRNFAFFNDLNNALNSKKSSFEDIANRKDILSLLKSLLTEEGLNYANLPKGLLKFHKQENETRTPVEEHLIEGAKYARSEKKVNLHFTVSENHLKLFKTHINEVVGKYENIFKIKYNINFSIQNPNTDTVAVDLDNNPFRDEKGDIVYRPGGHGALLQNLNKISADLVFVKNIDNVVQDRIKQDTILYKKALAGLLIKLREETFSWLNKLNKPNATKYINNAKNFVANGLNNKLPEAFDKLPELEQIKFLTNKLNRPIRVCGMVKNEGEPGGGPFWVENEDNSVSLQIVESSQIDEDKKDLMKKATHFNPVDLVCSLSNHKGEQFDLNKYTDPNTGFISQKSLKGRDLKALELPGLWNGAMANWNTVFVEVPISTFAPVKTVNDLLKKEHLYEKDYLI
ncbi:protein of unknown function [Lutibacter oricola]|uniref:DUF4301 domain-containing protein n=1 Tax=Lutibacter oricola TaxID=762486 RepID=A0A1H2YRU7_9FLAO|nr:DUF4301 family protein [Lutibacter oricola]SDX07239.1 protein of unknown function [Lutibacter oricola]